MRIRPAGDTPILRPTAAAPAAPAAAPAAPADSVQVDGRGRGTLSASGDPAVAAALQGTPLGLTAPVLTSMIRDLESKGVQFQRRRRILFWHTGWKPVTAEKAAKLALKGKKDKLSAVVEGRDRLAVRSAGDVQELAVFEGGRKDALPEPKVQKAVAELAARGADFGGAGPYGAYNAMTGDGFEGLSVTVNGLTADLRTAEDLYFTAWLQEPAATPALLAKPDLALALREIENQGLELSTGSAVDSYRRLRDGQEPPANEEDPGCVHVLQGSTVIDALSPADLEKPRDVAARLTRLKAERAELERLDAGRADEVWPLLRRRPADRPFADRAGAMLHLSRTETAGELYDGLRGQIPAAEPLAPAASELAALVQRFPDRKPEWQLQALEETRKRPGSPYLDLLEVVGEPKLAGKAERLARGAEPARRQAAITQLVEAAKDPAGGLLVAEELGDRLARDAHALAGALAECDGDPQEPLAAWKAARSRGRDLDVGLLRIARAMHESSPPDVRLRGFEALLDAHTSADATAAMGELAKVALSAGWSGAWTGQDGTWTTGAYGANAEIVLESRPMSLERMTGGSVSFEARCSTEESYDRVHVDISVDGTTWTTLASYSGKSDWEKRTLSLSGFEGRQVRLRFRLASDGSTNGEGFSFRGFRVEGVPLGETAPVAVFDESSGAGARMLGDVFRLIEAQPDPSKREDLLLAAGVLAKRLGSTRETARLLPVLDAALPRPELLQHAEALARVAAQVGAPAASEMWPVLTAEMTGPVPRRADRLLDLLGTARCLAGANSHLPEALCPAWTRLVRLGLDGEASKAMRDMAARLAPWEPEGAWAAVVEPGRGLVWKDSPEGLYRNNVEASLTSQPLSLRHHVGSRLGFQARHATEEGYDRCRVEVSENGKDWTSIADFSGQSDWKRHELDLAAWDGKTVRVRFRFNSDGSTQGDGFAFQDFRVEARPQWQPDGKRATIYTGDAPIGLEALVATLENCPPAGRADTAEALGRTAASCGSAAAAMEIWPAIAGRVGQPDFERQRDALARLAGSLGSEPALEIWKRLETTGDPAGRVEEAVHAFELGRLRAGRDALSYDLSAVVDVWSRLLDTPLTREGWKALAGLARDVQPWQAEGTWGLAPGPGAPTWSDSPEGRYRNNESSSLTSPMLSLENVTGAKAEFDAKWAFEAGYDRVLLEARPDGAAEWKAVQSFDGSSDWKRQGIDLSDHDGQRVQLRMRLHSDGSTNEDGLSFRGFQVTGTPRYDGAAGRVTVHSDAPEAFRKQLDRLLEATKQAGTPADRTRRVEALAKTARELQSIEAAMDLWPTLAPELGNPEFETRRAGLARLAREMGPGMALQVWGEVTDPESAVHHFRLARTLTLSGDAKAGPDVILARWRELRSFDLTPKGWEGLARVAATVAPFHGEGKWALQGATYSDSPTGGYGPSEDRSLTSHRVSLAGLESPVLRFREKHAFEDGYDRARLEVSTDGKEWREAATFDGSSDWKEHSVDLSAWRGQSVQVRFRLTSDGSNQFDGIEISVPVVEGRDPKTGAPVRRSFEEAAAGSIAVLLGSARATALTREERSRFLEFLAHLKPAQATRVLDFLAANGAQDLGQLISRVTTAMVVSEDLEAALEAALKSHEDATIRTEPEQVVIGGVSLPVQTKGQAG